MAIWQGCIEKLHARTELLTSKVLAHEVTPTLHESQAGQCHVWLRTTGLIASPYRLSCPFGPTALTPLFPWVGPRGPQELERPLGTLCSYNFTNWIRRMRVWTKTFRHEFLLVEGTEWLLTHQCSTNRGFIVGLGKL